jgi:hypothetical protein
MGTEGPPSDEPQAPKDAMPSAARIAPHAIHRRASPLGIELRVAFIGPVVSWLRSGVVRTVFDGVAFGTSHLALAL